MAKYFRSDFGCDEDFNIWDALRKPSAIVKPDGPRIVPFREAALKLSTGKASGGDHFGKSPMPLEQVSKDDALSVLMSLSSTPNLNFGAMFDDSSEASLVSIKLNKDGSPREVYQVDAAIAEIMALMNNLGVTTYESCVGSHKKYLSNLRLKRGVDTVLFPHVVFVPIDNKATTSRFIERVLVIGNGLIRLDTHGYEDRPQYCLSLVSTLHRNEDEVSFSDEVLAVATFWAVIERALTEIQSKRASKRRDKYKILYKNK